ncbi:uncharacterized protein LOC114351067 [Ostrinia furnacalis]|uniref:uncharacterized protein LOC114351067 n=1 Tax=Ostrinia furnacalis TaxID=93504 RepID=UPI001039D544|nr:uncharacterized protein LOC114351067 [Ostrinia furnacalis]
MSRLLTLAFYLFSVVTTVLSNKVYRTDYEYNRYTDAFYKLHIETANPVNAAKVCQAEGAVLMMPASQQDIAQLHGMFKKYPDLDNFVWVANDGQTHESAEEQPLINLQPPTEEYVPLWQRECDAVTREGEIVSITCFKDRPFICKVDAAKAPYNKECNVYGNDFQRARTVNSCYQIPTIAYTWNQAYAECAAEGAHLVVLNSQAEHDEVQRLMNSAPRIQEARETWFFHAGFRAQTTDQQRVFKTIFNETLEDAGYSTWADNEPNNALQNENCGTLFKNDGKLNDVDCSYRYGFICEKEITAQT